MTTYLDTVFARLVASYERTCGACPTQYEGTLTDGRAFYFRYRHGWASLGIGPDRLGAIDDPSRVGISHGGPLDGTLDGDQEFKDLFLRLAELHQHAPEARHQHQPAGAAVPDGADPSPPADPGGEG